jgi:hypothetical protein
MSRKSPGDEYRFEAGREGTRDRHVDDYDSFLNHENDKNSPWNRFYSRVGGTGVMLMVGGSFVVLFLLSWLVYANGQTRTRLRLEAKQDEAKIVYDDMWKVVKETFNLTDQAQAAFTESYTKIMEAQNPREGQAQLALFINRVAPNSDFMPLYNRMAGTIEAKRAEFKTVQTELIDAKREDDSYFREQPSGFFVSTLTGRQPMKITLVTSTRTGEAYKSGKDDESLIPERQK